MEERRRAAGRYPAEGDNVTGVESECLLGGSAGDTLFGSCRRPCYVEAQRAADGQMRSATMMPGACS